MNHEKNTTKTGKQETSSAEQAIQQVKEGLSYGASKMRSVLGMQGNRHPSQEQKVGREIKRRNHVTTRMQEMPQLDTQKPRASQKAGILSLISVIALALSLVIISIGASYRLAHGQVINFNLQQKK